MEELSEEEIEEALNEEDHRTETPLQRQPRHSAFFSISLVFLLIAIFSGLYWRYPNQFYIAASYRDVFQLGMWHTLLTSLFVHADYAHILANSPMMIIFGFYLQGYFGARVFPLSCLLIGVATNAICLFFMPERTYLIGASGMVYGMVSLWLIFYIRFENRYSIFKRCVRAFGFALLILWPTTYHKEVSYLAHGVGFAVGMLFGLPLAFWLNPDYKEAA